MTLRDTIKAAMPIKVSKAKVHYGNGHKDSHCGICRYFQPPESCEKVAGEIYPDKWCELFKRKAR